MNIVWFKRDLRIEDHQALTEAAKAGPVLPLFILEPELWRQPDLSLRHYTFMAQCLLDLNESLKVLGQGLILKVGNAVDVLATLQQQHGITALWSHQETWNHWTYERDRQVLRWARANEIPWFEPTQNGVIRRLQDRNGWASRWYDVMSQPVHKPPSQLVPIEEKSDPLPAARKLDLMDSANPTLQQGGRREAMRLLCSFLNERAEHYSKGMSSPLSAFDACSRLSAHLAFGTLSMREVYQATEARARDVKQWPPGTKGKWSQSLRAFSGRLRWHCHFIQKLEDEPSIEFQNMHPAYDGLREHHFNDLWFEAWKEGKTGYPMVDACMRALIQTGWINFRMRAMLMSFASYHLWLHWPKPARHLARLFADYEPGIHYSQAQMQSGTTGINSIRIYNPIKQGTDHDPDGLFIRHWIPELRDMETGLIHTPWKAPLQMNGYPQPIVDEPTARKEAASKLYSIRKNSEHAPLAKDILKRHGSRKKTTTRKPPARQSTPTKAGKAKPDNTNQIELPL
jgi:deoxyribodipyrimidine photo-lyase